MNDSAIFSLGYFKTLSMEEEIKAVHAQNRLLQNALHGIEIAATEQMKQSYELVWFYRNMGKFYCMMNYCRSFHSYRIRLFPFLFVPLKGGSRIQTKSISSNNFKIHHNIKKPLPVSKDQNVPITTVLIQVCWHQRVCLWNMREYQIL